MSAVIETVFLTECPMCGATVKNGSQERHQAWHEAFNV